jgi:transposase InsO family protein
MPGWGLVERSVTADDLIGELDRLATRRGHPAVLRCDNGPELACAAMAEWVGTRVGLRFIPPGEPWRNGYVESFNSRVRDECLNINVFWSLAQPGSSSAIGSANTIGTGPIRP